MSERNLAKSLHTITVLVRIGQHRIEQYGEDAATAVACACEILGVDGQPDEYGLKAKAAAQLRAAARTPEKPGEALAADLAANPLRCFQ